MRAKCTGIAHPGGHHQNAPSMPRNFEPPRETRALFVAQIVIEQHYVDLGSRPEPRGPRRRCRRLRRPGGQARLQEPAEALAEQAVIVHQQYPDLLLDPFSSRRPARAKLDTMKLDPLRFGLVSQIASERAHKGARQIQSEARRLRAPAERDERAVPDAGRRIRCRGTSR